MSINWTTPERPFKGKIIRIPHSDVHCGDRIPGKLIGSGARLLVVQTKEFLGSGKWRFTFQGTDFIWEPTSADTTPILLSTEE